MSDKLTSAAIGGLVAGLLGALMAIPQNPILSSISCLAYMLAGGIAVWHYTNEYEVTLTGRQGVGLGALSGFIGGIAGSILGFFLIAMDILPSQSEQMSEAMEQMEQAGGGPGMGMLELMAGPVGMLIGVVIALVVGTVMGLVGGAIGAAMFKRGSDDLEFDMEEGTE